MVLDGFEAGERALLLLLDGVAVWSRHFFWVSYGVRNCGDAQLGWQSETAEAWRKTKAAARGAEAKQQSRLSGSRCTG